MSRIKARFESLKKEGRGAIIPYLEAFDPDKKTSLSLLKSMPGAGADIIEIGVPFSDPAADGPTIQHAARRALKAGASLKGVLSLVREFRQDDTTTPVILMGYFNPVDHYGPELFCQDAAQAGVDGLILVDLPPEEADIIAPYAHQNALDMIALVSPNTPDDRLPYILHHAGGFVYFVSITGITGTNTATEAQLKEILPRLRNMTSLPVVTGFGITTPNHVSIALKNSDGAVMASILINNMVETFEDGKATESSIPVVLDNIRSFAKAARDVAARR